MVKLRLFFPLAEHKHEDGREFLGEGFTLLASSLCQWAAG